MSKPIPTENGYEMTISRDRKTGDITLQFRKIANAESVTFVIAPAELFQLKFAIGVVLDQYLASQERWQRVNDQEVDNEDGE